MKHVNGPVELFTRLSTNPILGPTDLPFQANAVFNPGATTYKGKTLLLMRVEHRTGLSSFMVATSEDGLTRWTVESDLCLEPQLDTFEEQWGIEDPRITKIGDEYYVVYVGYSSAGPLVLLATTKDFITWDRRGVLMTPDDKDAALFPVRFGDRWALIHRPLPSGPGLGAHVWMSFSPDLRHWGDATVLLPARRGGWWDANKIGLGPPPLLTDEGWLICYHGVRVTASGSIYRLGLALLDEKDPSKVIARGNEWIMGPSADYERSGDVGDVVFPCGWVLREDGETLHMYYGASDSVVCVAEAKLSELLSHLERHPIEVHSEVLPVDPDVNESA